MKLQLNINNQKEVFINAHVTGMMYRDALYLRYKQVSEGFTPSILDEMIGLICQTFNYQFSISEFYNGIDKKLIFGTVNDIIDGIITQDCNRMIDKEQEVHNHPGNVGKTLKELQNLFDRQCIHLINQGYKINEIDQMDMNFYYYLLGKMQYPQDKNEIELLNEENIVYLEDIL